MQNIVFTAVAALAALGVYLLAGRAQEPGTTGPEPSPTPAESEALAFVSVPEDVFTMLITTSRDDYLAAQSKTDPHRYGVRCGAAKTGGATLTYTVGAGGRISSVTLTFPRPGEAPAKPKTLVEQKLVRERERYVEAQNEAVQTILCSVFAACDLNDVLLEPVLLKWYTQALLARDEGKQFAEDWRGCTFETYPSAIGREEVFICSLMAGE